ncbi:DUF3867 family protein [Peptostreptococcus sp. D1]|uniref:DUF3867 family protein n=1 Tax=Peptostreptococcus sp. D1 TaxID=72304 RepID=UPI0008DF7EC8|nr:DUF3867 family protein [Peptostreptococcus sp. D1]SFE27222.1 Protein of unknown function [Peptostreptococcus sp. D1]
MSDDKVISFNKRKSKVKSSDVDKFEEFISDLMYGFNIGEVSMFEVSRRLNKYMNENNFSAVKFDEIEKQLLLRYGLDIDSIQDNIKEHLFTDNEVIGDIGALNKDEREKNRAMLNRLGFYDLYEDCLEEHKILELVIKNDVNDIRMLLDDDKVTLISEKKIDFSDDSVNRALAYYRSSTEKPIKVTICEATSQYEYH